MVQEKREFTYETGVDEPIHPSMEIRSEMTEVGLSSCPHGCKIYKHPRAAVLILSHNASYGCKRTREDILADFHGTHSD